MALLLDIPAPRHAIESRRAMRTDRLLFVVMQTPDHSAEIRAAVPLLGIEREKRERIRERFAGLFPHYEAEPVIR